MDGLRGAFVFVGLLIGLAESSCKFPQSLTGTWESSDFGTIEINSTTIGPINTTASDELLYECYTVDGTKYISRSTTTVYMMGDSYYFYMCMDHRPLSQNKHKYYLQSSMNPDAEGKRLPSFNETVKPTVAEICNTTLPNHAYSILIKNGTIHSETIPCPSWISGTFNYTSYDGTECAVSGSEMSTCKNRNVLYMNYTMCSYSPVLGSSSGSLGCLYSSKAGSVEYLTVYNIEENTNETTFLCLVGEMTLDRSGYEVMATPSMCPLSDTPMTTTNPCMTNTIFTLLEKCPKPNPYPHGKPPHSSAAVNSVAFLVTVLSLAAHAF